MFQDQSFFILYFYYVLQKVPAAEKASILRTLRDHLHQCPSKLSEEMVRCMAIVCYWLRGTASVSTEKNRSPFLSRSSTNVIQTRRGVGEDQDWSGQSMVEILWISTDKSQFSHASYAINNYRFVWPIQRHRMLVEKNGHDRPFSSSFWSALTGFLGTLEDPENFSVQEL